MNIVEHTRNWTEIKKEHLNYRRVVIRSKNLIISRLILSLIHSLFIFALLTGLFVAIKKVMPNNPKISNTKWFIPGLVISVLTYVYYLIKLIQTFKYELTFLFKKHPIYATDIFLNENNEVVCDDGTAIPFSEANNVYTNMFNYKYRNNYKSQKIRIVTLRKTANWCYIIGKSEDFDAL